MAPDGSLDNVIARFIERQILPKSASSLRIACRTARSAVVRHYDAHIQEVEKFYLDALMSTADAVEGIEAFLEKRSPKWVDG